MYGAFAFLAITIQFTLFKILYPFPDFLPESYNYIDTASQHLAVNVWPVGYGKFIWLIHCISISDTFLIGIQYLLLEAALAYLFFTVLYLYKSARMVRNILFAFLFINPLFLYLSNCILPDALFASLSIVFLVQFCWMFHRPAPSQFILQGVIAGLAFTISFAAVFYPLVCLGGVLLLKKRPKLAPSGWIIGTVLIVGFLLISMQKTKEATGTAQLSVLGSWQLANNALYMYGHTKMDSTRMPKETRTLDRTTRDFFEDIPAAQRDVAGFAGAFFLVVPYSPLKVFMDRQFRDEDAPKQFEAWAKVAPLYAAYGKALIRQRPVSYVTYFVGPNIKNYFLPPLEKFEMYNLNRSDVPTTVQEWFGYMTPDIAVVSATFQARLFYPYRYFFLALNVFFWGGLIWWMVAGRVRKMKPEFRNAFLLTSAFLVLHLVLSVIAAPVVLRCQVVPMILLVTFCLFLSHPKTVYA